MTDEELKELVASLAVAKRETDRQLKETDWQLRKQLKELGKQIGGLGEKFSGFTEGMALPSMTKILTENFGMEVVTPRVRVRKAVQSLELDVLAYANSECNAAYVVEIKSHLRPDGIEQLQNILKQFRTFFQKTPTRPSMEFLLWLMHLKICDRRHCQQEFSWLESVTSSSNWKCPKIFSPNSGEQQFERFAAFLVITKTALLPLLSALLRRAYHLISGKPSYFSASRAKRGEPLKNH